jgi:PelA/Pel-15E family pectate lyase
MQNYRGIAGLLALFSLMSTALRGQDDRMADKAEQAMLKATRYMVENVSCNGGYLWYYLPDFSRQWGEMEAYRTMIWFQRPGTVSMGHIFLDAYQVTGNEYFYQAAEKVASALLWAQSTEGGWNYMADFAGDRSLKKWYATIGKNGWRLEEFQHYYGNSTFDDGVTSNAAWFLLRIYLEKMDPKYRPALDRAINFILESQYPLGGWPQRYPLNHEYSKNGRPDYSSYYTFNDEVIQDNINFLIRCYLTLGKEEYLDPIRRGMNFYLVSQQGSGAWAQQYDENLEPAGARSYEPGALSPSTTFQNAMSLIDFYEMTGEQKFLLPVTKAITWLEKTKLQANQTLDGRYTHPTYVEPGSEKPLYVHRKGSNVKYGYYYYDYSDENLLGHYGGKRWIPVQRLKDRYDSIRSLDPREVKESASLLPGAYKEDIPPQKFYNRNEYPSFFTGVPDEQRVNEIINSLDSKDRWLTKRGRTSNPYAGDGQKQELTEKFNSTDVGDETDTSPYGDTSGQEYISTGLYLRNMMLLLNFLESKQ